MSRAEDTSRLEGANIPSTGLYGTPATEPCPLDLTEFGDASNPPIFMGPAEPCRALGDTVHSGCEEHLVARCQALHADMNGQRAKRDRVVARIHKARLEVERAWTDHKSDVAAFDAELTQQAYRHREDMDALNKARENLARREKDLSSRAALIAEREDAARLMMPHLRRMLDIVNTKRLGDHQRVRFFDTLRNFGLAVDEMGKRAPLVARAWDLGHTIDNSPGPAAAPTWHDRPLKK